MHEAWYTEDAPETPDIHASAREAATVARDAGVQELVLIHLHPHHDPAPLPAEAAEVFEPVALGVDGLQREL